MRDIPNSVPSVDNNNTKERTDDRLKYKIINGIPSISLNYTPPKERISLVKNQSVERNVSNHSDEEPTRLKIAKKKSKKRRKCSKNRELRARKRKRYRENLRKPDSEISLLKRKVNRARNRTANLLGKSFDKAKVAAILLSDGQPKTREKSKEVIDKFVKLKRDQAIYRERAKCTAQSFSSHQQALTDALNGQPCSVPKLMNKELAEKQVLQIYKNKKIKF